MGKKYTAKEGDTISSIAYEHSLFPDTVWHDEQNKALRESRDSDLLCLGDIVYIPEKVVKQECCASELKHTFRRKGVPDKLKMILLKYGRPRAKQDFDMNIDGQFYGGTSDEDGLISISIPPDAKKGYLIIGKDRQRIDIELGVMDPITEQSGVIKRLFNLGYVDSIQLSDEQVQDALDKLAKKYAINDSNVVLHKLEELHDGK